MRTFAQKAQQPTSDTLRRPPVGQNAAMSPIQQLQRRVGNQALQRMLQAHAGKARDDVAGDRTGFRPEFDVTPIRDAAQPQLSGDVVSITGDLSRGGPAPVAAARRTTNEQATGAEKQNPVALGPPIIAHQTAFSAPDKTADTRNKVGVGEIVLFTASVPGTWTASEGKPTVATKGSTFEWIAPARAASVTINLRVGWQTASETMTVVEPTGLAAEKVIDLSFPSGTQGAGMLLRFCVQPANVVFGAIQVNEVPGDASSISGVFETPEAKKIVKFWHTGSRFVHIGFDNKATRMDHAESSGMPPNLWQKGSFEWCIPNHFSLQSETGDGKWFTETTQRFELEGPPDAGRTTVIKLGQRAVRKP